MARKLYEESDIQALQNAIRSKTGSTDTFSVSEMRESIERIEAKNVETGLYIPASTGIQTITHNLGRIPEGILIFFY